VRLCGSGSRRRGARLQKSQQVLSDSERDLEPGHSIFDEPEPEQRLENVEVSDDADLAAYLETIVGELFEFQVPGEGFSKRPIEVCRDFECFGEQGKPVDDAAVKQSTDAKKYFDESPFGNDINRAGLTFLR